MSVGDGAVDLIILCCATASLLFTLCAPVSKSGFSLRGFKAPPREVIGFFVAMVTVLLIHKEYILLELHFSMVVWFSVPDSTHLPSAVHFHW